MAEEPTKRKFSGDKGKLGTDKKGKSDKGNAPSTALFRGLFKASNCSRDIYRVFPRCLFKLTFFLTADSDDDSDTPENEKKERFLREKKDCSMCPEPCDAHSAYPATLLQVLTSLRLQ